MLRKGLIALGVLLGFLLQTLIPLAQTLPVSNNGENLVTRLVICSGLGTKTIDIATGAEVPDDEETPAGTNEYVVCLAKVIGLNVVDFSGTTGHVQIALLPVAFALSPRDAMPPQHLTDAHGARAPPIV